VDFISLKQEKSYYALAAFCEDMGEEILPFLDPLMMKLLGALQNSPRNLQETCMVRVLLMCFIICWCFLLSIIADFVYLLLCFSLQLVLLHLLQSKPSFLMLRGF
jgi:hypothetical protein